jgi:hypothetical protein
MTLFPFPLDVHRRPWASALTGAVVLAGAFAVGSFLPKVEALRRLGQEVRGADRAASGKVQAGAAARESWEKIRSRIPPGSGIDEVTGRIELLSQRWRVQMTDISTEPSESVGAFSAAALRIAFRGRAREACEFLEDLKRIDRLIGFEALEAEVRPDGNLTVDATLRIYGEGN